MIAFVPIGSYPKPEVMYKSSPTPYYYGANPSQNFPVPSYVQDFCFIGSPSNMDSYLCSVAAGMALDADRKAEGLPPLRLPDNWNRLNNEERLFVLINLERVDRGLSPVNGILPQLNLIAKTGSLQNTDPVVTQSQANSLVNPDRGFVWASNWSGADNPTLSMVGWMYDDGYAKSPTSFLMYNDDCVGTVQTGCWGHRDNILMEFHSHMNRPVGDGYITAMGAYGRGNSMAEIMMTVSPELAKDFIYTWQDALKAGADANRGLEVTTSGFVNPLEPHDAKPFSRHKPPKKTAEKDKNPADGGVLQWMKGLITRLERWS